MNDNSPAPAWVTMEIATRYCRQMIRGEHFAMVYLRKILHRDIRLPIMQCFAEFEEWFNCNAVAQQLYAEICADYGVPPEGTREHMIFKLRREIDGLRFVRLDLVYDLENGYKSERAKRDLRNAIKRHDADVIDAWWLVAELRGWIEPQSRCDCAKSTVRKRRANTLSLSSLVQ